MFASAAVVRLYCNNVVIDTWAFAEATDTLELW